MTKMPHTTWEGKKRGRTKKKEEVYPSPLQISHFFFCKLQIFLAPCAFGKKNFFLFIPKLANTFFPASKRHQWQSN
jgi:hypothetical protein